MYLWLDFLMVSEREEGRVVLYAQLQNREGR